MITWSVPAGMGIYEACDEAVALAFKTGETVWFEFNDTPLLATGGMNPDVLYQLFQRHREIYKDIRDRAKKR